MAASTKSNSGGSNSNSTTSTSSSSHPDHSHPSSTSHKSKNRPPKMHILIVGGGIGGLMLGIMLERAGISYQILERSPEHRPLGSAISLNGTVLRLFEQLGLLEELHKISKFAGRLHLVKEDLETQGHIDLEHFRERYGYYSVVFGRPDLFKMLVSHIPSHKLLMSKRILSTSQTELGVLVRCSDGSTFHGDVLVGADGAYSSIRQCMHKSLKEKGLLPKSDSEQLKFDQHCVVGITNELDPERYPILKEDYCELFGVIGKKRPYTIWLIPITGNRFAWSIGGRVPDSEVGQEDVRSFSFAEWWPELATDVCDLVRNYTLPDFKVLYHHDEHYKTTRPEAVAADSEIHDHSHHDEGDEDEEESDGRCSVHSGALSDTSPVSSSASSAMTDGPTARYRRQRPHQCQHPHQNGSASSSAAKGNSAHLLPPTNPMRQTHSSSVLSFTSSAESAQTSTPKRSTTVPPPPTRPGTVAEIIDATNTDRISKVMLESKMFKVWHHERTVLIGDACHKVLPFAGQGAIQAILDGISLANALYDMKTNSIDDITKAFKRYSHERIPIAKAAVTGSRSFGKLLNVQGKVTDFIRKISFSRVPNWVLRMATDRLHLYRPQLTYLPMVPDRGVAKAYKQDYSPRYLAQLKEREERKENRQKLQHHHHHHHHHQAQMQEHEYTQGQQPPQKNRERRSSSTALPVSHSTDAMVAASIISGTSSSGGYNEHLHHKGSHHHYHGEDEHHHKESHRHHHGENEHHHRAAEHPSQHHVRPHPPRSHTTPALLQDCSSAFSSGSGSGSVSSTRKMSSSRLMIPPPLPLEAPPRHHPSIAIPSLHHHHNGHSSHSIHHGHHHHHAEDKVFGTNAVNPSASRTSSTYSSSRNSSSYSLSTTGGATTAEDLGHSGAASGTTPRVRRHTVTQSGRSRPSSPKSAEYPPIPPPPQMMSLPLPLFLDTHHHQNYHPPSPLSSPDKESSHFGLGSPTPPPRSPLGPHQHHPHHHAHTPPPAHGNALRQYSHGLESPMPQFRRPSSHQRTKSLHSDQDVDLASEILALEQTTVMMKERARLREQRSLDQMNAMWKQHQHQRQFQMLHSQRQ